MVNYEIEHSIEMHFSGSVGKDDGTAQLWVPTPKGTKVTFSLKPTLSSNLEDVGCTINYWRGLPLEEALITCSYRHSGTPRVPPVDEKFISKALGKSDPLTVVTEDILRMPLLKKINGLSTKEQIKAIEGYLVSRLEYEHPPETREASEVLKKNKSDCGGYHSAFVALARSLGIPAVLDFGFRTETDAYHAWAWWFDRSTQSWNMEDINDIQNDKPIIGRVSMTLSTAPGLVPPFPLPVLHLQSHLVWIDSFDELRDKGLVFSTDSTWKISRFT